MAAGDDYKKMRDGRLGDNPELFRHEAMAWEFEYQPLLRKAIRDLRGSGDRPVVVTLLS